MITLAMLSLACATWRPPTEPDPGGLSGGQTAGPGQVVGAPGAGAPAQGEDRNEAARISTTNGGILQSGMWVQVNGTGSCLRLREAPGTMAAAISCQPDGFIGQIARGPVDAEADRWWLIAGQLPESGGATGGEPHIERITGEGWAASRFLSFLASGVLTFKGVTVGDRMGDFTVKAIKGFRGYLPDEGAREPYRSTNWMVLLTGETVAPGSYQWNGMCGWSFGVPSPTGAKLPNLGSDREAIFSFRNQDDARRSFAPDIPAGGEYYPGLTGRATVRIRGYFLVGYPAGVCRDVDLVEVLQYE